MLRAVLSSNLDIFMQTKINFHTTQPQIRYFSQDYRLIYDLVQIWFKTQSLQSFCICSLMSIMLKLIVCFTGTKCHKNANAAPSSNI